MKKGDLFVMLHKI